MKIMGEEEMKRGLWSEQEDAQLVYYVKLFGDRRWDFISKVSGLKRTGKSCRLRWVNYLDPGLKRGKMTPREEKLVIQLHSKWGNRWSRIAGKLPGRTDNEIKNFWRTYMRHKAQEKKRGISSLPSLSTSSSSSSSSNSESNGPSIITNSSSSTSKNSFPSDSNPCLDSEVISFYDTGGMKMIAAQNKDCQRGEVNEKEYSMDDIWKDIDESENNCDLFFSRMDSPIWNYCPDILWSMDTVETENFPVITDQIFGGYDQVVSSSFVG